MERGVFGGLKVGKRRLGMWRRGVGRGGGSSSRPFLGEARRVLSGGAEGGVLCKGFVGGEKGEWRWECVGVVALWVRSVEDFIKAG